MNLILVLCHPSLLTPIETRPWFIRGRHRPAASWRALVLLCLSWIATMAGLAPLAPAAGLGLKGEYYDNPDFTQLRLTRTDSTVNFSWDTGAPDPSIGPETFSVRWTGQVIPRYSQNYTFYTMSDDGVRLWINGTLIIDNWTDHAPTENAGIVPLVAGQAANIVLEYYENGGGATMQLSWSSPTQSKEVVPQSHLFPGPAPGLVGEYYNDLEFTERRHVRTDATLDFSWDTGSPHPEVGADTFSVRWTGQVVPRVTESYTLHTVSDDGVRVWLGGILVIDNWTDHAPTEDAGSVPLLAGHAYDLRVEYYENGGGATMQLLWSSARQPREVIPQSQLYSDPTAATGRPIPPLARSTSYHGTHSSIVHFDRHAWMNTDTVHLTAEAWIYANDLVGHQAVVARDFNSNLYFGLNGNRLLFYRSGGFSAQSELTVPRRRWTHVAVAYDGARAWFTVNGTPAGNVPLSHGGANNSTAGLSLGGQRDNSSSADGRAFNGYLDEVRLWSVARSVPQIASTMNVEVRSGTGLLAAFGSGGDRNDVTGERGTTTGVAAADRLSGFGILPAQLAIPWTRNLLRVDGVVDLFNEYRGAETFVLRSTSSAADNADRSWDLPAYLMVSNNGTNQHLFVGLPHVPQGAQDWFPTVQLMGNLNPASGTSLALGDWECRVAQDGLQGGRLYSVNPPVVPDPRWLSWGQSPSNWEAVGAEDSFEFHQSYEFRIHAEHLNHFTNSVGLLARYFDYDAMGFQLVAPRGGVPDVPLTYTRAEWAGLANPPMRHVTLSGSVSNVADAGGVSGIQVWLTHNPSSGLSADSIVIAGTMTDAQGHYRFAGVAVPGERHLRVSFVPPAGVDYLSPHIESTVPTLTPTSESPTYVTFAPCPDRCSYAPVHFRYRQFGPVQVTGVAPASVPGVVVVRTSPVKRTPPSVITVHGANFRGSSRLFFKGSGCSFNPPSLCGSDFFEATIVSVAEDGRSLTAEVPSTLSGVEFGPRTFQLFVENPSPGSTGGNRWNPGPDILVTPPLWAQLHGWAFPNRDDHPSVQEFEDSFGDSIFTVVPFPPFKVRDPAYGVWAAVYFGWMESCEGSCYGMAGAARLMQEGTLPVGTYDVPDGDGVHGVRFGNGYFIPMSPPRWTGWDFYQPFRAKNLWARIQSLAGAQTSAEALLVGLAQLGTRAESGPRRGWAAGNPLDVLNRVRATPGGYTLCVQRRDFGDGHCITPYGVVDGQGLDAAAVNPIPAPGFSLIKVYDNNWPEEERLIEINRVENTYRYDAGIGEVYEGPGLFFVPMSVYRGPRRAPDSAFLGIYGVEYLRLLAVGTSSASVANASGERAGWSPTELASTYSGALPYAPVGLLSGVTSRLDNTMLFLPRSNAPASAGFYSRGSNVLLYAGMGPGDLAFGFQAPNTAVSNSVDGIVLDASDGLRGLGLRVAAPVFGFSAIATSREANRQSRVWILDAGAGSLVPDLHLERDGLRSLKIRNRSTQPVTLRLTLAGVDPRTGAFEHHYELPPQPALSTLALRAPEAGQSRSLIRELDSNNDTKPEVTETVPAQGDLRVSREGSFLALRWRQAASNESLQSASTLTGPAWAPASQQVSNQGPDRVAYVVPHGDERYFRVQPVTSNCLSLATQTLGSKPNPWEIESFKFEAFNALGSLLPQNLVTTRSGSSGLDVGHTVVIQPQEEFHVIHLDVRQTSGFVTFEAIGPLGTVVSRETLDETGAGLQRVTLRTAGQRIHRLKVTSPNALCLVVNVCGEQILQP